MKLFPALFFTVLLLSGCTQAAVNEGDISEGGNVSAGEESVLDEGGGLVSENVSEEASSIAGEDEIIYPVVGDDDEAAGGLIGSEII